MLVSGMSYAFVFQDAIHFGLCDENVMTNLADAIEDCTWSELEAWLDNHHDALIQCHKAKALILGIGGASSPPQRNSPSKRRNGGDGGSSGSGTSRTCPCKK